MSKDELYDQVVGKSLSQSKCCVLDWFRVFDT